MENAALLKLLAVVKTRISIYYATFYSKVKKLTKLAIDMPLSESILET
jgi:hypothetical protein